MGRDCKPVRKRFMALPETHEYRKAVDIQRGDFVHRWGDELLVQSASHHRGSVILSVEDGGVIKKWSYKDADELICQKRDDA